MTSKKPKEKETAKKPAAAANQENDKAVTGPVKSGSEKYYEAVGRRKEAVARIRVYTKKSTDHHDSDKAVIIVNGRDSAEYFGHQEELQATVESPLQKLKSVDRFKVMVQVQGGGIHGQAEAIRHGLSRALVLFDLNFAKKLKKAGYLTRDPRAKERRKYGKKKARKSPQWAKR